jgi:hypothetical protein
VLAARPLRAGGEPLRRATPDRLSGAPEKELLTRGFGELNALIFSGIF